MGTKLDSLFKIIEGVVGVFEKPDSINDPTVEICPSNDPLPFTINNNIITINSSHPDGGIISQKIFEDAESLMDKGDRVIEKSFAKLITDAEPYASSGPEDDKLLEDFKVFIPATDVPIVKAALFIRRLYRNKSNVSRYKQMVYTKYLSRGNNITNLVSANYYEDYLYPNYKHLVETEGEFAVPIFNAFYEEAVTQYPFAVFVSSYKPYEQLKDEIINKVQLNLATNQHILNIHGIGKNNKKIIISLLKDSDIAQLYVSEPDIVELEKTLYVKLYF